MVRPLGTVYTVVWGITAMTVDDVFHKVQEGDIAHLRARDQLNIERGKGAVFNDFNEG